ncbi:hypothetical protein [Rubritalea sp.]|uniref:hypothetical protein n=1 Tax=Rubritalea sp. TaxID=2109375 RepID=UPI003EF60531
MPNKKDILDLYFMPARRDLIEIAAYLDRLDRHDGEGDFRVEGFQKAIQALLEPGDKSRAEAVLLALSDDSETPIPAAIIQGAFGAPNNAANK